MNFRVEGKFSKVSAAAVAAVLHVNEPLAWYGCSLPDGHHHKVGGGVGLEVY